MNQKLWGVPLLYADRIIHRWTNKEIEFIKDSYEKNLVSVVKIAKLLKTNHHVIYKILKKEGIEINLSKRRRLLFENKMIEIPMGMLGKTVSEKSRKQIGETLSKLHKDGIIKQHCEGKTKDNYEPLKRAGEKTRDRLKDKTNHPMYGKKRPEVSKKLSEMWKDNFFRENTIKHLKKVHKGKHYSPRTELKRGNEIWKFRTTSFKGEDNPMYGKTGENSPGWKGGIQHEPYDNGFDAIFKRIIRKRDNQVCMVCMIHTEKLIKALDVHHINYDKRLSIAQNCVSLCSTCHGKTNFNRNQWLNFFQDLLSKKYGYEYNEKGETVLELRKNE